jgi:hypothetical protein
MTAYKVQQKGCRRNKKIAPAFDAGGGNSKKGSRWEISRNEERGLFAVADDQRKTLLDPGLDDVENSGILEVGAGVAMGEVAALLGPGLMDGASFTQAVIGEQNTGPIFSGFEGVFTLQKPMPDLPVADGEVPRHPIDIVSLDQQGRPGKPVAAVAGAVVAVHRIAGQGIVGRWLLILHQRKLLDSI